MAYSPAERDSAEWQNRLRSVISAVADWKEDTGFTAAEHFRFKVSLFSELLALAPAGANRDAVLRANHEFLRQSRLEVPSRTEWFLPVSVLVGRVGVDPAGLARLGDVLCDSPDPVIALYARLERAAPRTPDRILALF
jgi:hypothetical protein